MLFRFHFPDWMVPFADFKFKIKNSQSVQPEGGIDRVPALVDLRTGGQILQAKMSEKFVDHLHRQVIDGWWIHFNGMN